MAEEQEEFGNQQAVESVVRHLGSLLKHDLVIGADSSDVDPGVRFKTAMSLGLTAVRNEMPIDEDDGTGGSTARPPTEPTPFPGGSTVEDTKLPVAA